MGIKGLHQELGPGQRIALSKLAAQSFVHHNRPFRLAVDIAIWQFQTQAAQGGTNPAIRTLFYRLTRLLGAPIEPIFVFDGPNKPALKRNKRSGRGDGVAAAQAKQLIRLFGFTVHDAPGEAEADCALLQRHGIVDAVLSEDVDTVMFGCTRTLRNWSSEGKGTVPTHVSLYDIETMGIAELGLDREGMILVALMSGGDYLPDGIPGCGVKVACQAARAGFGKSLCRLKTSDKDGLRSWRNSLAHELKSNQSGYFKNKHNALKIPDDFPNLEVLRYYTHPVVSPESHLEAIRQRFHTRGEMHLEALREFARETFDWDYLGGAIKFIKVLAPARLIDSLVYGAKPEDYVNQITGHRSHVTTDGSEELRVSFIPQDLVPIDLSKEVEEEIAYGRNGLALNSDDEFEAPAETLPSKRTPKPYDPAKPEMAWVLGELASRRIPHVVEDWRLAFAAKESRKTANKQATKATAAKGKKTTGAGTAAGTLDQYVRVSKAPTMATASKPLPHAGPRFRGPSTSPEKQAAFRRPHMPPALLEASKQLTSPGQAGSVRKETGWTIASSQVTPRKPKLPDRPEAIVISSSPAGPPEAESPTSPALQSHSRRSQELPESVRAILAADDATTGVRREPRPFRRVKTTGDVTKTSTGAKAKLKQASLDGFAKRSRRASASQPAEPGPAAQQPTSKPAMPRPVRRSTPAQSQDPFLDSDADDLAPLSSLLTKPTVPPSKKHGKSPARSQGASRDPSPSPRPARKKLFVPRVSDAGFFREIEVDADERDAVMERETARLKRRGVKTSVIRLSDVSIVDLTQDD